MKYSLFAYTVLLTTLTFAQQQGQPPPTSPPYQTPPTFPEGRQAPGQQMPPDEVAPPSQELSPAEAKQQISDHLKSEPALQNAKVVVRVDQHFVELKGSVSSETQHDLALRIAKSYAGNRKIVDKIKIRQQA